MALEIFQSSNFRVQFESTDFLPNELQIVQPRAAALPSAFEADFATLCGWFGIPVGNGFGPSNRVIVTLSKAIRGASNGGYNTNNPSMTVNVKLGGTQDSVVSLFVAEMIEILMSFPGNWRWQAGDSGGEGLSRVAADLLHPLSAPATVNNNVNAWLASDPTTDPTAAVADSEFRKDWVAANFTGGPLKAGGNVAGDQDSYSFGCGWQEVPGGVQTDQALAAAMQKDTLFVFARLQDGRILFNQAAPGGAFVGWQEMPGGVVTNVALASAGRQDNLFVFARALDGRILFNQAAPGGAFVGWQEVPGGVQTDQALAAAMQKDTLFVFAKLQDGRILFNQAAPGGAFVGWQEMPGGVVTNIALASAGRQDNLFVFARALDGRILFNQAAPGGAFVGWQEVPGGVQTDQALAAGMQKDTLFVFAKLQDGRILFNQAAPGGAFAGWQLGL